MALTEKGDKRLEVIKQITQRLRGIEPDLPGQGPVNDPAVPRNAGRPVNE